MADLRKKKFYRKRPRNPVEVVVYDILLRELVIAEYRHESKETFDGLIFKVYHPVWAETGGARWVKHFVKNLGSFVPDAPVTE